MNISSWFKPNAQPSSLSSQTLFGVILVMLFISWNLSAPGINLPTISQISDAWIRLVVTDKLLYHLFVISFPLEIQAILLSTVISLFLVGLSIFPVFNMLTKIISALRFNSLSGILYIFIATLHDAHTIKLAVLTFGMTVFLVPSLLTEANNVPMSQKNYVRTLGLSEWEVFMETSIIGKLDIFWDNVFNNAAMGLLMMVMIEAAVVSEGGIGVILMTENHTFHLDSIFAIQFTILTFGIIQDLLASITKRFLFPYSFIKKDKSS